MKAAKLFGLIWIFLIISAGCEKSPGPERAAYESFLAGEVSLFDDTDMYAEGLDIWKDTILSAGELEYTLLDLDGDGTEELLVQYVDSPSSFNGVFHYSSGKLCCWQFDYMEGTCRDYPLQDGTMVRQYDTNGTSIYTLFRYQKDGEAEELLNMFAREELPYPESTDPCPYYEIGGNEVDRTEFDEQLDKLVQSQMLERTAWTAIQPPV